MSFRDHQQTAKEDDVACMKIQAKIVDFSFDNEESFTYSESPFVKTLIGEE